MQHDKLWFRARTLGSIGRAVRELREEAGFTQSDFAERLNCSRATVGRMEQGTAVTADLILRAAGELGDELVLTPRGARVVVESDPR